MQPASGPFSIFAWLNKFYLNAMCTRQPSEREREAARVVLAELEDRLGLARQPALASLHVRHLPLAAHLLVLSLEHQGDDEHVVILLALVRELGRLRQHRHRLLVLEQQ